ncbi:MAG TPA: hypothetical protein V6D05_11775 [Stenomitos sp.]
MAVQKLQELAKTDILAVVDQVMHELVTANQQNGFGDLFPQDLVNVLAQRLGLNKNLVRRILQFLTTRGFLGQEQGYYYLTVLGIAEAQRAAKQGGYVIF